MDINTFDIEFAADENDPSKIYVMTIVFAGHKFLLTRERDELSVSVVEGGMLIVPESGNTVRLRWREYGG